MTWTPGGFSQSKKLGSNRLNFLRTWTQTRTPARTPPTRAAPPPRPRSTPFNPPKTPPPTSQVCGGEPTIAFCNSCATLSALVFWRRDVGDGELKNKRKNWPVSHHKCKFMATMKWWRDSRLGIGIGLGPGIELVRRRSSEQTALPTDLPLAVQQHRFYEITSRVPRVSEFDFGGQAGVTLYRLTRICRCIYSAEITKCYKYSYPQPVRIYFVFGFPWITPTRFRLRLGMVYTLCCESISDSLSIICHIKAPAQWLIRRPLFLILHGWVLNAR